MSKKIKVTVHLQAIASTSIEVEVEEGTTENEIIDMAYSMADISKCEPSTWDVGCEEVVYEDSDDQD